MAHVVFFAGLEGSGHHYLESVMKLAGFDPGVQGSYTLDFPREDWACGKEWQRTGVEKLQAAFEKLPKGSATVLPQQESYPQCGFFPVLDQDGRKDRFHPRLDWIQEAAAKAGVMLHVLLLFRPVVDCTKSLCTEKGREGLLTIPGTSLESCPAAAESTVSNAQILVDQLRGLPRSVPVACQKYGDIDSMIDGLERSFAKTTASFERPLADLVKESWRGPSTKAEEADPPLCQFLNNRRNLCRQKAMAELTSVHRQTIAEAEARLVAISDEAAAATPKMMCDFLLGGHGFQA